MTAGNYRSAMSMRATRSASSVRSTCALVIMAKAPIIGFAKTRLIPALGEQGAALLAQRLLHHTVDTCLKATCFAHVELCVTPNRHHQVFEEISAQYGLRINFSDQIEGDLGKRMHHTFERLLKTYDGVILIGTDAPELSAQTLEQATLALDQHDAVFVPAHDGGYALIGLSRLLTTLFTDMAWSTDTVMQASRDRLEQACWFMKELAPVFDIDEPADLQHLPVGWTV